MVQSSKMLVIVDPMRARIRRFDPQGQEIIAKRDVFRAASANLMSAIANVIGKKADVHTIAADYRKEGARCDMQQFAKMLTSRLREGAPGEVIDLAVLVTCEMAEAVNEALHPELTHAVRVFHKVPCCNMPESMIAELVTDWLHNGAASAPPALA
jgi:hypothetical protein